MIQVEQIEANLYVYRWIQHVNMKEAQHIVRQMQAERQTAEAYVAILDLTQMIALPSDIAHMRANVREEIALGLQGYVIHGASRAVASFLKPLALLAPTTYKIAFSWEEALSMARGLLQRTPEPG